MISHLLLVLLLPVYVNTVKELFSYCSLPVGESAVFPKASAKVLLFLQPAKFFHEYFQKKINFYGLNDRNQEKTEMFGEYEQRIEKIREDEPNSARVDKAGKMRAKDGSKKRKETILKFLMIFRLRNNEL